MLFVFWLLQVPSCIWCHNRSGGTKQRRKSGKWRVAPRGGENNRTSPSPAPGRDKSPTSKFPCSNWTSEFTCVSFLNLYFRVNKLPVLSCIWFTFEFFLEQRWEPSHHCLGWSLLLDIPVSSTNSLKFKFILLDFRSRKQRTQLRKISCKWISRRKCKKNTLPQDSHR